jgi:DNA primase
MRCMLGSRRITRSQKLPFERGFVGGLQVGGFIDDDKIAEVRNTANIVDVISPHVTLRKAGKNHVGLCPFHADKDPSFTVSEEKQIFHCFGCGQGGNAFSFLMQYHNIGFPEAVRMLGQQYGIVVPAGNMLPTEKRELEERDRLFDINKQAAEFFLHCLQKSHAGKPARQYLENRGVSSEILEQFCLGYAPEGWDNLVKYFGAKGISLDEVEKAGLIVSKKRGFYDRFRARIMFPIIDVHGRIVGFGGRCLDNSLPKYLNSPDTPIYHKRHSLYGLRPAQKACRDTGSVFLVEGYFDVLALHGNGINNVVAALGTAITRQHIRILKGYAKRIILVFDSDEAGMKAAERSMPLFVEEKVKALVMSLPQGKDPDDYIREFGPDNFAELAEKSLDMMGFLVETAVKKYGLSPDGKIRIVEDLTGPIVSLQDGLSRAVYIKALSERLDIDESAILEKVCACTPGKTTEAPAEATKSGSRLEETVIAMMIQSPEMLSNFDAREIVECMESSVLKKLGKNILAAYGTNGIGPSTDLITHVEDSQARNLISSLSMTERSWDRDSCLKIVDQYRNHLKKKQERALLGRIREAEKADDQGLLKQLLEEKQKRLRERLGAF